MKVDNAQHSAIVRQGRVLGYIKCVAIERNETMRASAW